jgi:hypothetical protein
MKILELLNEDFAFLEDLEGQKALRGQWIKEKLGPHFKGIPGYPEPGDLDKLIDKIGEVDPSTKGIYMPWIARMAIGRPGENRAEDLDRVGQDLRHFEQFKRQIENKDINSYKGFQQLYDVIAPFLKPRAKTKAEKEKDAERAMNEKMKGQIIDVYRGPEGWIKIPTTNESSCWLGRNTRWCTASTRNSMFGHYSKSDNLFVVYDKATGKRHQLHIQSGQFADEADRNVGIKAVPEWARKPIVDYYKNNNPTLSRSQIISLTGFGGEDVSKGTKHEALVDLMKKYNVV